MVADAPLDAADAGPVELGLKAERLLGEPLPLSLFAQRVPHGLREPRACTDAMRR
jgi:hypothetical protein